MSDRGALSLSLALVQSNDNILKVFRYGPQRDVYRWRWAARVGKPWREEAARADHKGREILDPRMWPAAAGAA